MVLQRCQGLEREVVRLLVFDGARLRLLVVECERVGGRLEDNGDEFLCLGWCRFFNSRISPLATRSRFVVYRCGVAVGWV